MGRKAAWLLAFSIVAAPLAATAQDVSADPTYGSVSLDAGFLPDPHTSSVTSGGKIQVDAGPCGYGFVANAPDLDLYYSTSGSTDLYVYAEGEGDTTLLINLPNGDWVCDDDSHGGTDPLVVIPSAADGLYDIWVGSYSDASHSATLYISEIRPDGATGSRGPDYTLDPAFGSVSLEEGFLPDPHTVDVIAGGDLDVSVGACSYGYVATAPDYDLYYETDGGADLFVYAESKDDTTLLINTPSGEWICNDDGFEGTNPLVAISNAEDGLYNIWVGSYSGERNASTKLRITEIDPR